MKPLPMTPPGLEVVPVSAQSLDLRGAFTETQLRSMAMAEEEKSFRKLCDLATERQPPQIGSLKVRKQGDESPGLASCMLS